MKLADFAIENRVVTLVLTVVLIGAGVASYQGMSRLEDPEFTIKDQYDKASLPQVWDELRRKVGDAQADLPPGASPSLVIDDYGDVYGVFFTVSSDDYFCAELKEVVDLFRRELLLVADAAKVETFGEQTEAVYVELDRDRMSQLGISPDVITSELQQKNA